MKPLHQASENMGKDQHNSDLQQNQYIQSPTSLFSANWRRILSYDICLSPALTRRFAWLRCAGRWAGPSSAASGRWPFAGWSSRALPLAASIASNSDFSSLSVVVAVVVNRVLPSRRRPRGRIWKSGLQRGRGEVGRNSGSGRGVDHKRSARNHGRTLRFGRPQSGRPTLHA